MKTLVIIRHAKSSWEQESMNDFDRPLNERGRSDAPRIGAFLRDKGIKPDLIYSSPANRALTTASLVAHVTNYPLDKIVQVSALYTFDSDLQPIIELLRQIENSVETVFLFGHNDTFTYLTNQFANHRIDHLPTCGAVCLRFVADTWQNFDAAPATMDFAIFPKKLNN